MKGIRTWMAAAPTRPLAWLALLALSLAGCAPSPQEERFTVLPDVMIRLVAEDACRYCKAVEYSPDGKYVGQIRISTTVLARAGDIDYVSRSRGGDGELRFVYKTTAQARIHDITSRSFGRKIALMAGGRAVNVATISGPFSAGSQVSGLDEASTDFIIGQIAGGRGR
ncbi:MAG TPA: hypothetical protein VM619_04190 [Luteimonas sp.]|nr:hypothetical protein [Luteimonas sp.]